TEVFAHGALCMCYSGQCLMSSLIGGRSGNRGACAQPCRLPYTVCDKDKNPIGTAGKYYMSLRDLCTVDYIGKLIDIGVDSLKIEGRMKSSEYVSIVTGMYNKYRSGGEVDFGDMQLLENVFSRSGFTKGYLYGDTGRKMLNFDSHNDDVYRNIQSDVHSYADSLLKIKKLMPVDVYVSVVLGQLPYVMLTYGQHTVTAYGEHKVQAALRSETTPQRILEQTEKFGGTPFEVRNIDYNIDSGINIPIKEINNMRRNAVAMLEDKILSKQDFVCAGYDYVRPAPQKHACGTSAGVRTYAQAVKAYDLGFDRIYIPHAVYMENKRFFDDNSDIFVLMLPAIARDELLDKYTECDLERVCVSNISHIQRFSHKAMCANYTMNVYNSMAQQMLKKLGVDSICLSPELNIGQINSVCCDAEAEIMVYGRIALMTVKNCLVKSSAGKCGCSSDVRYLKDRRETYFPFYTDTSSCTNTIYNSVPLYMGDRRHELDKLNVSLMRFDFTDEDEQQMEQILAAFDSGKKMPEGTFTRGQYYRGVG
ncbi:MAG: U32 family peptidase, partial [Clostridia bacterium]|nr:U32 family peptidase [Clostridia bacterium]